MSDRSKFFYWTQLQTQDPSSTKEKNSDLDDHSIISIDAETARLWPGCAEFIASQSLFFLASANWDGQCQCNFQSGEPGFVLVEDNKYLYFPDYRKNGRPTILGNFIENPYVGLLFVDFQTKISVKVNGKVTILEKPEQLEPFYKHAAYRKAVRIIRVEIEYVASNCLELPAEENSE
ncbi:MAG TPA: hypothetical protein ENK38_03070 [Gammaproteobacteria bacterium]|nr:hypothetical protein [Gammaproteobacteria bacterium]